MSRGAPMDDFGARVRTLREEAGETLRSLGAKAGISFTYLSEVERGIAEPTIGKAVALAKALGVPLTTLVDGPPVKPRRAPRNA